MTYQVIRKTNNWNRRGQPVNVVETVIADLTSLKAAFALAKYEQALKGKGATYAPHAVAHRVVDATGAQVFLVTLFEQMHPHLYEAIEHQRDEGVSNLWIDLDGWFGLGCPGLG